MDLGVQLNPLNPKFFVCLQPGVDVRCGQRRGSIGRLLLLPRLWQPPAAQVWQPVSDPSNVIANAVSNCHFCIRRLLLPPQHTCIDVSFGNFGRQLCLPRSCAACAADVTLHDSSSPPRLRRSACSASVAVPRAEILSVPSVEQPCRPCYVRRKSQDNLGNIDIHSCVVGLKQRCGFFLVHHIRPHACAATKAASGGSQGAASDCCNAMPHPADAGDVTREVLAARRSPSSRHLGVDM